MLQQLLSKSKEIRSLTQNSASQSLQEDHVNKKRKVEEKKGNKEAAYFNEEIKKSNRLCKQFLINQDFEEGFVVLETPSEYERSVSVRLNQGIAVYLY